MRSESVTTPILNAINMQLRKLNGYAEVLPSDEGFIKRFCLEIDAPRQLLAPVAEAAADLLCYGNPVYVKKCENPDYVLYFLSDESRGVLSTEAATGEASA